jgi:hypothetical protein
MLAVTIANQAKQISFRLSHAGVLCLLACLRVGRFMGIAF